MDLETKKILRTLQSEFPFLKSVRESFSLHTGRILHRPHEDDFCALDLIPESAIGSYIDVGANNGQSIESISLFKPHAHIISFEANRLLAAKLARRYRDNSNVNVVGKGLSDSPGTFPLFVPSYKGFVYDALASLDRESAAGWINERTMLGFKPEKLTIAEDLCEVVTLDSQQLAPAFIKIDVQGYEFNVLNGARDTLRRHEPVLLVEVFRSDDRTVRLADELGYEEYYFDGSVLQKGQPKTSPNSFLVTSNRFATLGGHVGGGTRQKALAKID